MLYPTRDETVAAIARNRERLSERLPRRHSRRWDAVRWAWDKRNTAEHRRAGGRPRAAQLAARRPRRARPDRRRAPWAVKPAIKEHFFYATKAKAWRADSRAELRDAAREGVGDRRPGPDDRAGADPGDGRQQFAYCALYSKRRAGRDDGLPAPPPASAGLRPREHVRRDDRGARGRGRCRSRSCARSTTTASSSSSTSATRAPASSSCSTSTRAPGATTRSPPPPASTSRTCSTARRSGSRSSRSAPGPASAGSACSPTCRPAAVQIRAGDFTLREYLRTLRSAHVEAVFSRDDPKPGLAEVALLPYLAVKRGF